MGGQVHRTNIDRVAILEIDNPPVNAMSQPIRRALADHVARADSEPEIGAMVILARGRTFVTGIDLTELGQKPRDPGIAEVVDRIEAASKPVVVAWHGTALGAGCEIGLAAHRRVMGRQSRVGLPDIRLGLVPGAGGTQRLPRLIGLPAALDLIATGRVIDAMEAFGLGLCDEVTDGDLRDAALKAARALIGKMQPRLSLRPPNPPEPGQWDAMVERVRREARHRIAPLRAIELVGQTLTTPYAIGGAAERRAFLELTASDQSRALRHLFFAERALRKRPELAEIRPRALARIGIVGSGSAATGIAATLAERGLAVTLVETAEGGLQAARERVAALIARGIRSGRVPEAARQDIAARLSFQGDLAAIAGCDLVIEAIFDDLALKRDLFERLEEILPPQALLASASPISDHSAIAGQLAHPGRYLAMHFLAPAPAMRIVELGRTRQTRPETLAAAYALLDRIDRMAIPCLATEGLVGSRIVARFRAQCDFMLEEGALPAEIDRALEAFGLPIGPFAAQDLAGLDIAWARRKRQAESRPSGERDVPILDRLCERGHFGQKVGKGWYRYRNGQREPDPDVEALIRAHAASTGRRRQAFTADAIQLRVLAAMVNEGSRLIEAGIVARPAEIDLLMVHGHGFPAWRGGPMQEADARGLRVIQSAIEASAQRDGTGFEACRLVAELIASGRTFAALNRPAVAEALQPA